MKILKGPERLFSGTSIRSSRPLHRLHETFVTSFASMTQRIRSGTFPRPYPSTPEVGGGGVPKRKEGKVY